MAEMITDLANLLLPHDPATLEQAIIAGERLHLHTSRSAAFQAMLPWGGVSDLVTLDRLLANRTRVMVNGRDLPLEMFTRFEHGQQAREIVPNLFQELCGKGASVVINGIDKAVPEIAATVAMIQRHLGISSGVNAYVSFRRSSAFRPHWDGHNVLLLQLYGGKRWKCYGRREALSPDGYQFKNAEELGEPEWDAVLEPGDILYLPRGEIHAGAVTDSQSLHLTVAISPNRGVDFVNWLAMRASDIAEFHQDIPARGSKQALNDQFADWRKSLHELVDSADWEEFLAERKLWQTPYRPVNIGRDDPVAPHSWIKPSLRRSVALPVEQGGKLEIGKMSVDLSAPECVVLDMLMQRHAVRFGELAELIPGLEAEVIAESVTSLSRKSLVFLLD